MRRADGPPAVRTQVAMALKPAAAPTPAATRAAPCAAAPSGVPLPKTATDAELRMMLGALLLLLSFILLMFGRCETRELLRWRLIPSPVGAATVPIPLPAPKERIREVARPPTVAPPERARSLRRCVRAALSATWIGSVDEHDAQSRRDRRSIGLVLFGQGAWIHAKAMLAQILLERAFAETSRPVRR